MAACFMANLILDGYKIHAEKMNYIFIKAENVSRCRNEKKPRKRVFLGLCVSLSVR